MNESELLVPQAQRRGRGVSLAARTGIDDVDVIRAAQSGGCVLLTGARQAAAVAHRIHSLSGWRWGPFVAIDCGGAETVVTRQLHAALFPAERHAEDQPRPRLAQAGTLFLHEVGNLSPSLQAELADALAHAVTTRGPGGTKRVMASTSEPLLPRVADGTFYDQLFYRLNTIHIMVPPG